MLLGAKAARTQMNRPIVLGQVYLSFYAVTGAVVREVLERLGHTVVVREGPHEQVFPLLGQGEIDLMAAAWLPEGHATYWTRYGREAEEVATLYDGARFFWAVPSYVPESQVHSITDLIKPYVAERMSRRIQGIGTGATISVFSETAIREYGLGTVGYTFQPGTQTDWTHAYDGAIADRRWFVFPTWQPQYLNRGGALRPLEDPRSVLGGVNRAALVGPTGRLAELPDATRRVLARIKLGLDSVTEMDWLVNIKEQTPRDAARAWMKANEHRVASWFDSASPCLHTERDQGCRV